MKADKRGNKSTQDIISKLDGDGFEKKIEQFSAENKDSGFGERHSIMEEEEFNFQEQMEKLRFAVQKNHIYIHTILLFMMICFIAYQISSGHTITVLNLIGVVWVVLSHGIDFLLCRKKYNFQSKILIGIKINLLTSVIFFSATFELNAIVSLFGFAVYILYFLEYIECIEFTNPEEKEKAAVLIAAIFAVVYTIVSLITDVKLSLVELLLLMGIVCLALYTLVEQIYNYLDRYLSYITRLNHDKSELENKNSLLNEQSVKIKEAVDLLGVQKIELSKAYETIQIQNQEMKMHNEILGLVSTEKDMDQFAKRITDVLISWDNICAVGLFIDALIYGNTYPLICTRIPQLEELETEFESKAEDILFEIHHFDEDFQVNIGSLPEKYQFLGKTGVQSLIRIQILTEGGMCGALVLGSKDPKNFDSESGTFYLLIATQIGIAVKNANLYATMENLATRDGLTGIYNRRHFNKLFSDYVTAAMDKRQSIAVALFDIDKFKNVNDTYGHSFGDMVIVTVSHIANEIVEQNGGILGRYGGEEFMMAFLNKNVRDILPIVEEIHERIKQTELSHNGQIVKINVSIGVTDYPNTCSNPADLLNHADWAMYYSKQHGRGRITVDGEQVRAENMQ